MLQATEAIRRQLENDPAEKGTFLSEMALTLDYLKQLGLADLWEIWSKLASKQGNLTGR